MLTTWLLLVRFYSVSEREPAPLVHVIAYKQEEQVATSTVESGGLCTAEYPRLRTQGAVTWKPNGDHRNVHTSICVCQL